MKQNKGLDLLLHFNKVEALGRIYLEALEYGIPLIGYNVGGINELAHSLGLEDMMVDGSNDTWASDMYSKLLSIDKSWNEEKFAHAIECMTQEYSPLSYTQKVESLFDAQ